ncbi:MAG TPA: HAMP domain-containing sensor histidine kinase [Chloroflexota bacterium]
MPRSFARLRWQLTLSHLIAIAFTLICMVAGVATIASAWWGSQNALARRPEAAAQVAAQVLTGVVEDVPVDDLDAVLRVMASGRLRFLNGDLGSPHLPGELDQARYLAVVSPDGVPLASSAPQGAAFAPPERAQWAALANQALGGTRERPGSARVIVDQQVLGAAPIFNALNRPVAVAIVALPVQPVNEGPTFWPLAFFGVAMVVVLVGASVFALVASSIVGYLLSRRLVGRLEELSQAAESLRSGDLSARVPQAGDDEVTELQRSFNKMAADLETAVGEVSAERDRITGLLEARRQLVASVSHELRTPVATVRGYLESALRQDGVLPASVRADLDIADREVARLEGLIDDLFTLARAEVSRLDLRLEPADLGQLVQRQVETYAPLAWQQRRVEVLAETPSAETTALVDAQRVGQIVSNLLANAIRHTPPGGLVAAGVSSEDGFVRIEVRDTGEGIAPEVLTRIWERFYHGQEGEGAGLGLALVKELAESMGGRAQVTSTTGEGTAFSVRLPAYHPAA